MVVPRAPNTASPSSRVRTSTSLLSRSTRSRSAVASPTPPPRSRRAGWFSGALRKLWSSESLSVTRCMSEQANAERCLSLDRRLGRRSRNGRVRRGVRRHRLYPRPFSHLTTWRPWSVTHGADMSRAGVVLEAARDITVRGESPAHRPSGRPRISSRARPPCRRPGAGWPERPMPRRGQSSPGLVRVGIARNVLHRHLLTRHSGRRGYPFDCPWGATPLLLGVNGRRRHNGWGSGTASWCLGAVKWIPPSAQIDAWKSFPARCDSVEPSQSMSSGRDVMRPPERPAQPRADRACSPCGACQVCTGEGSGARRCDSQPVGILRAAAVQSRGGFFGSRSSTPLKGPGVDFDST